MPTFMNVRTPYEECTTEMLAIDTLSQDYGSEQQIDAQNELCKRYEDQLVASNSLAELSNFESYALKATTTELVVYITLRMQP